MKYVYLLNSLKDPVERYVGLATDLKRRLAAHKAGQSVHTAKYRLWKVVAYFAFDDEKRAIAFERYLKSGSGRAFANRHLWWSSAQIQITAPAFRPVFSAVAPISTSRDRIEAIRFVVRFSPSLVDGPQPKKPPVGMLTGRLGHALATIHGLSSGSRPFAETQ